MAVAGAHSAPLQQSEGDPIFANGQKRAQPMSREEVKRLIFMGCFSLGFRYAAAMLRLGDSECKPASALDAARGTVMLPVRERV
jgi:hypothetical protein